MHPESPSPDWEYIGNETACVYQRLYSSGQHRIVALAEEPPPRHAQYHLSSPPHHNPVHTSNLLNR